MLETLRTLDDIRLNFNQSGLFILNLTLAFVMFGVALEIKPDHFKKLFHNPRSAIVGVISQFLLLPFVTFLLVVIFRNFITPTVGLGMILIAACPGGNISNFISSLAKGNLALSVSLTAIATLAAVFMTPLNFSLWGNLFTKVYSKADASNLVRHLEIDVGQMFLTVFILLGIPLLLGIFFNTKLPKLTDKILVPVKRISLLIFTALVIILLAANFDYFKLYIKYIFIIVLIHNFMALFSGYMIAWAFKRPKIDRRTISIETGIQNSGLALVLIFNPKIFPPELSVGGMAFIAAWWGIWHILAGITIGSLWSGFSLKAKKEAAKN
jgi:BASS family bile acid:Na+ symporter